MTPTPKIAKGSRALLKKLTFVLGGAASGKSAWAEDLVTGSGLSPVYLATAEAGDHEMRAKIARHAARRDERWRLIEVPLDIAGALRGLGRDDGCLIDCATLWLGNLMGTGRDPAAAAQDLLAALDASSARVVVVSNEVGQGIVPADALSRRFREAQGRLNAQLAAQADLVVQVIAGLPLVLKGQLP